MRKMMEKMCVPNSGPQTLGIISRIAEQEGSSKHSCRANKQFNIAIVVFVLGPETRAIINLN